MNISLQTKLVYWTDFIKVHPDEIKGYIQRGMVYFKLAKIEESIQDFDQAEMLDPAVKPYLWQRGLSYYYTQQYQRSARSSTSVRRS